MITNFVIAVFITEIMLFLLWY